MRPATSHSACPNVETRLMRNLARLHGRDPAGFDAIVEHDEGAVRVRCPTGAAFYPRDG